MQTGSAEQVKSDTDGEVPAGEEATTFFLCVRCGRPAIAEVEISLGLEVGVCWQHWRRAPAAPATDVTECRSSGEVQPLLPR